jgi:hypothetical protein
MAVPTLTVDSFSAEPSALCECDFLASVEMEREFIWLVWFGDRFKLFSFLGGFCILGSEGNLFGETFCVGEYSYK